MPDTANIIASKLQPPSAMILTRREKGEKIRRELAWMNHKVLGTAENLTMISLTKLYQSFRVIHRAKRWW